MMTMRLSCTDTEIRLFKDFGVTLPCETHMLQIVALRGNYLYQMAYLRVVNSTEGATWFNNFEVLNVLC